MADTLAKAGGKEGIEGLLEVPKAELKQRVKEHYYTIWKQEWVDYKGARMSKQFYPGPDSNQANYILKLGRIELSRVLRLISGHNGLFYFKSKIDPVINPQCRFCLGADETFYHLITDCPAFKISRDSIFLDETIDVTQNWSVRKLLDFSYLAGVREAIDGSTELRLFVTHSGMDSDSDYDPP